MSLNPYARTQAELDDEYEGHRVRADRWHDDEIDEPSAERAVTLARADVEVATMFVERAIGDWRKSHGEAREWWRWQVGVCIDDLRAVRAKLELAETVIECGRIG